MNKSQKADQEIVDDLALAMPDNTFFPPPLEDGFEKRDIVAFPLQDVVH